MKFIDKFLNSITMYKLVLYGLLAVAVIAIGLGFFGLVPFTGLSMIMSLAVIWFTAWLANMFFSAIFRAPKNAESDSITALILFFILNPPGQTLHDIYILVAAAVIAMASKYLLALHKRHIFNPAAITAVILSVAGIGAASWWVASPIMLPFVLILGLLIVHKIRRFAMFLTFVVTSLIVMFISLSQLGQSFADIFSLALLSFPIFFFSTVMLTEPITTPPRRHWQIVYAILVGILFAAQFHIGPVYSGPALALVIGNIFSYIVSQKRRLILTLKEKSELSPGVYEFVFASDHSFQHLPGQYFEWTLEHENTDFRGNRRFFTIASSPTESDVRIGVRMMKDGSSFKEALMAMQPGAVIAAGSLGGEFVMPKDANEKLVFIAGGIGVTPFRSMIKYLVDKKEKREVTLFYAAMSEADFAYTNIFDQASAEIGLKVVKMATDATKVSDAWKGKTGFITKELVAAEVPDYMTRTFYLSGPNPMVQNYKNLLLGMGVKRTQIKTDYFPGF